MPSQAFLWKDDDDERSTFSSSLFYRVGCWIYAYNGREIVVEDSTANLATASSKIVATFIIMIVWYCQPMSLLVKESDMPSSPTAVKIGEVGLQWPWSKPTHPLSWLHRHMPSSLSAFIHSARGPVGSKKKESCPALQSSDDPPTIHA